MAATMKAVNYSGPFKVTVQDVEKPGIEHPDDVIVKVTTSGERSEEMQPAELPGHSYSEMLTCIAICGSDLHMYEGRTGAQPGITFGYVTG